MLFWLNTEGFDEDSSGISAFSFVFFVFCSDLFGDCIDFFFSGEDLVQCGPVKEDQGYDAQESCQKQKDADHAGFLHIL